MVNESCDRDLESEHFGEHGNSFGRPLRRSFVDPSWIESSPTFAEGQEDGW